MDTTVSSPPSLSIVLSQEELLVVLDALQTRFIPGLDAEAVGALTGEQLEMVLPVAQRALQARNLAQVGENGRLHLHRSLLTAVGVCAYSQSAAMVYHWTRGGEQPEQFFGHIRGLEVVAHTCTDGMLHQFSLLPSKEALVDHLLVGCECTMTDAPTPPLELTISQAGLTEARLLAEAGAVYEAGQLLLSSEALEGAAQAFAQTLAASPRVSILQTLKQQGNEMVYSRQFTLLHDESYLWFVMPTQDQPQAPLLARTATAEAVRAVMSEWL